MRAIRMIMKAQMFYGIFSFLFGSCNYFENSQNKGLYAHCNSSKNNKYSIKKFILDISNTKIKQRI